MNDLISRSALLELREEMWQDRCDHMVVRVTNIENAPAVDAVPVVRCKDCKYPKRASIIEGFFICGLLKQTVKDDDYCSYGERRNGDG